MEAGQLDLVRSLWNNFEVPIIESTLKSIFVSRKGAKGTKNATLYF